MESHAEREHVHDYDENRRIEEIVELERSSGSDGSERGYERVDDGYHKPRNPIAEMWGAEHVET